MITQQKQKILNKFLTELNMFQADIRKNDHSIPLTEFDSYVVPEIDLVSELIKHQKQINATVDQTYGSVQVVLKELSELQTRKQNVSKLLDSMTAIKDVKRLSFGLGSNPQEIYKNLVVYYQVKSKLYYCHKYVEKVEEQISKIKQNFQTELEQQLKKANSQNITDIAKTINLISHNSDQEDKSNTNDQIVKFYVDMVKKQLKTYEEDLFKIPINAANTTNCYIFFDIAKDVMKMIVTTISNYKGNILKIGGQETLQKVIAEIFATAVNGIILEIFMREKKYFDCDTSDSKKICKDSNKFKDYLNEFCAIWNQIERLKAHLVEQIPQTSPLRKGLQNCLSNCVNSKELITINTQTSEGIVIYTRFQFNNLLKSSTFVNSLFQHDYEFLNAISNGFAKGNKQQYQSAQAHDFLVETFSIVIKSMEKTFQSLNMLIISPFITFANNHLIQEDSFHAFNQLLSRALPKMSTGQQKYYTTIIILLNTVILMPSALSTEILNFKIPNQLEAFKVRLESQLKQLVSACEYKTKQVVHDFIKKTVSAAWFTNELKQDYRKAIDKWKGFAPEINQIFLSKATQLHCSLILAQQFNLKAPKKIITQQGVISLEKEVRNAITFYEVKGCSALNSFRRVLEYIQVLLAENDDSANKLCKKFGITEPEQTQKLTLLRAMKVD